MNDRLKRLEETVGALGDGLSQLAARVERLERRAADGAPTRGDREPSAEGAGPLAESAWGSLTIAPASLVSLTGRTLIILAGAYGVRAVTDFGYVPQATGVALGLAYAAIWLAMVVVHARADRKTSALFFGFAASLVAYPLIWETTARFELIGAATGALLLSLFFVASLAIAVWAHLPRWAWATTLFASATAVALFVGTRDLIAYSTALLVIAAATELASVGGRWLGLRWPVALTLDLMLLLTIAITTRSEGTPDSYPPVGPLALTTVLLALPVIYLSIVGVRTLGRAMSVRPFEIVQSVAALLIGLGGAARIAAVSGGSIAPVGAASAVLGTFCYVASFSLADRRKGHQRNFFFYSTLGGLLVLSGTAVLSAGTALALVWGAIGLGVVWAGRSFHRQTLRAHGAVFVSCAAIPSGLLTASAARLAGPASEPWIDVTLAGWLAAAAIVASFALIVTGVPAGERTPPSHRVPRVLLATLACWSLAGLLVEGVARATGQAAGPDADAAVLAATRTGIVALSAVALAWAGGRPRLRELGWLTYPVLVAGGLKLVAEDFLTGRPVTLFASLALYGAALIVAPRIGRRADEGRAPS